MILSHSRKFIFIHLYKTGGTSVRRCLERYDAGYKPHHWVKSKLTPKPVFNSKIAHKHATAKAIRETVGADVFDRYFSFCFVRNPWAWQVSLYHYVLKNQSHDQYDLFKSFQGFDEYLAWRCDGNVQFQKDYLVDNQNKQIVKFIGRMETVNQDFETICEQLGLGPHALPHLNSSDSKGYRSFYDSKAETMLAEAFQPDIEMLGYEF